MDMVDVIKQKAREILSKNDNAHGYEHAERVANLAEEIRKHEGGDKLIISAVSYLHDLCAHKGRAYHVSDEAMGEIKEVLKGINFPEEKINPVIDIIKHHEDYDFNKEKADTPVENEILLDADRLDALGAIGIGRCFYTSAALNQSFGTPEEMEKPEGGYDAAQKDSALRHFYTKLLNLKDSMNTEYAKQLAGKRHEFMIEFLKHIKQEWSGEI